MNRSGEKTLFSVREWIIRGGFPIDSVMTQIESSLSLRQASAFTFFFFSFHFHVVFFHSSPLSLAFAFFFYLRSTTFTFSIFTFTSPYSESGAVSKPLFGLWTVA
jgi:hypothetical protein